MRSKPQLVPPAQLQDLWERAPGQRGERPSHPAAAQPGLNPFWGSNSACCRWDSPSGVGWVQPRHSDPAFWVVSPQSLLGPPPWGLAWCSLSGSQQMGFANFPHFLL